MHTTVKWSHLQESMNLKANKALQNSIYDGIFANMFATLTGGMFLTGLALHLNMGDLIIGLLGSIPFLVTIFQLPASYFVEKNSRRKQVAYQGAAIARLCWIPILVAAFLPGISNSVRFLSMLSIFLLAHMCASISYVSWLSWTSDMVPEAIRGRFFGTRNMFCGLGGMAVMLLFGNMMDLFKMRWPEWMSVGFSIAFISAAVFGLLSLHFMRRIPDLPAARPKIHRSFRSLLYLPLRDRNFRYFLSFNFFWSFSVYFASPFFTMYFLRYLKLSYGFIAVLGIISGAADLFGMQLWGRISDKVRNKVIIQISCWFVIFLPIAWATVSPGSVAVPVVLHLVGGGFWAGINLCMNNLLLRISPQENKALFLSTYSIVGGMSAALAPVLAGLALRSLDNVDLYVLGRSVVPLQAIFFTSTLLRLLSFQFLKYVHEPEEVPLGQLVRVLRGVRGLNTATGFNSLLHPFVEVAPEKSSSETSGCGS